uniref:FBA_2 domain-containing protein n=1 Tax=Panagrellus redivivus TaxID=6233 RepID=A0A7E4ZVB5_PANRE
MLDIEACGFMTESFYILMWIRKSHRRWSKEQNQNLENLIIFSSPTIVNILPNGAVYEMPLQGLQYCIYNTEEPMAFQAPVSFGS